MANRLGSLARLSRSVGAETTSDDVSRDSPLTNNEEAAAAQPAEQIAQDAGQDAGSKKSSSNRAEAAPSSSDIEIISAPTWNKPEGSKGDKKTTKNKQKRAYKKRRMATSPSWSSIEGADDKVAREDAAASSTETGAFRAEERGEETHPHRPRARVGWHSFAARQGKGRDDQDGDAFMSDIEDSMPPSAQQAPSPPAIESTLSDLHDFVQATDSQQVDSSTRLMPAEQLSLFGQMLMAGSSDEVRHRRTAAVERLKQQIARFGRLDIPLESLLPRPLYTALFGVHHRSKPRKSDESGMTLVDEMAEDDKMAKDDERVNKGRMTYGDEEGRAKRNTSQGESRKLYEPESADELEFLLLPARGQALVPPLPSFVVTSVDAAPAPKADAVPDANTAPGSSPLSSDHELASSSATAATAAATSNPQEIFRRNLLTLAEVEEEYSTWRKPPALGRADANKFSVSLLYPTATAGQPDLSDYGPAVVRAVTELATLMPKGNGTRSKVQEEDRSRFVHLCIFILQHTLFFRKDIGSLYVAQYDRQILLDLGCSEADLQATTDRLDYSLSAPLKREMSYEGVLTSWEIRLTLLNDRPLLFRHIPAAGEISNVEHAGQCQGLAAFRSQAEEAYKQALREACSRSGIVPSKLGKKLIQWDTRAGLGLLDVLFQGFQAETRLKDVSFEAGSGVKMSTKAAANRDRQKKEWAHGATVALARDFHESAAYVTIRPWIYAMKNKIDAAVEKEMNDSIDEVGEHEIKSTAGQNFNFFNRVTRQFSSPAEQAQTARFMRCLHEVERIAASPPTSLPTIFDRDGEPLSTSGDSVKAGQLIESIHKLLAESVLEPLIKRTGKGEEGTSRLLSEAQRKLSCERSSTAALKPQKKKGADALSNLSTSEMWWIEPPAQQKPDLKEDGNGKNGKKGPPTTTATMGKGEQGEAGDREAGGVGSVDVGAEPEEGRTPFRKLQRDSSREQEDPDVTDMLCAAPTTEEMPIMSQDQSRFDRLRSVEVDLMGVLNGVFLPVWDRKLRAIDDKEFAAALAKLRSYDHFSSNTTIKDLGYKTILDFRLCAIFLVSVMVEDAQLNKAEGEKLLHAFDLSMAAMAFTEVSPFLILLPEVIVSHTIHKKLEGYETTTRIAQFMSLLRQALFGMALLSDAESSAVRAVRYEDDKQHKASVRISNYTRLLSASDGMCARPTCDRCLIADVENLPQISKRGRAQRALSVCSVFSRKSILEEEFVKRLHLPIRFVECSIGPCPSHLCTTYYLSDVIVVTILRIGNVRHWTCKHVRDRATAFDVVRVGNAYIDVGEPTEEARDSDEDLDKESGGAEE